MRLKGTLTFCQETDAQAPEVPERLLLASVLDRAYRDLVGVDRKEQADALDWFLTKKRYPTCFSYQDCVEILKLGEQRTQQIACAINRCLDQYRRVQ